MVAGETSDTIISTDLRTKVKTYSNYIYTKIDEMAALDIYKPSIQELLFNVHQSSSMKIQTSEASHAL